MIEKIPFNLPLYTNTEEMNISALGVKQNDAYLDKIGNEYFLMKRPGLKKIVDLGIDAKIDGLYRWEENGYLYAVCNGFLYEIQDAAGAVVSNLGEYFEVGKRPTFAADDEGNLYIANGGNIYVYNGTTVVAIADADAPTSVSHIAWLDGYLLANSLETERFYWSDIGDGSSWTYTSFASAEGDPDILIALTVMNREIHLIGTRSVEYWFNTGNETPFQRYEGAFIQHGCIAPDTVLHINGTLVFFDQGRNLIMMNQRTPVIISREIAGELNELETVSDAKTDYIKILGKEFILLSFPTEDKTFVYEITTKAWQGEWSYWNSTTALYERFKGNCYVYSKNWNLHLFGDRSSSVIYMFDKNTYSDDGDIIRTRRRTGYIDWGKRNRKRSRSIEFKLLRGKVDVENPELLFKTREDGFDWLPERKINLGSWGERYFFSKLAGLGSYKARQYEIVHTNKTPLVVSNCFEEFNILGR